MCEPMTQIVHKAKALCINNIAAKTKEKKVSDERWLILACIVTLKVGYNNFQMKQIRQGMETIWLWAFNIEKV